MLPAPVSPTVIHHAYATVYTEPDLQVWWMAVRLWLAGIDPYGPIGDRLLGTGSDFAYPFPAVLICLPLALLSLAWASTVWALMSLAIAGVLPIALHNRLNPRIVAPMLAYFPLWASLEEGQWGPMLLLWTILSLYWLHKGRWLLSSTVATLTLLKPNVGIALLAGNCSVCAVHQRSPSLVAGSGVWIADLLDGDAGAGAWLAACVAGTTARL
ncbi:MAG: hypothetical protein RMJ48_07500 [Roseiflexaceae bacterium]|nr:hypothetical protein [Roseiflexaceae bacterium]